MRRRKYSFFSVGKKKYLKRKLNSLYDRLEYVENNKYKLKKNKKNKKKTSKSL